MRLYAGAGFDSGGVLAVEGNEGYAMWLPPGVHSDEARIADLLRHSVAAKRLTEITRSCRADGLVSTGGATLVSAADWR
jgi:hypothetical protein